jgi:predicted lactoylglutathione lyase
MTTKIFVNLPVKDLSRTVAFFTKLGFTFNPQFTDENATWICDTSKYTEAILALSADTREKADQMIKKAIESGGSEYREPQDHGWMYGRSFQDIDGHIWEIIHMDESAMKK